MYFINSYIPYPSLIANIFIFYMISSINYDVWSSYMKTGKLDCSKYSSRLLTYVTCGWMCYVVTLGCPLPYIYNHTYQFFTFATWYFVYLFQRKQITEIVLNMIGVVALTIVLLSFHHFYVGAFTSVLNIVFIALSFIAFKKMMEDQKSKPQPVYSRILEYINIVGFFFAAIQNIEGDILHFPFLQGCIQFAATVAQERLISKHKLYSSDSKKVKVEEKSKKD